MTSMTTRRSRTAGQHSPSSRPRPVLAAAGAAIALAASVMLPTAAHAAAPPAGQYTGTSSTDGEVSFTVDDSGVMSEFSTTVYCFIYPLAMPSPVIFDHGPDIAVQAGAEFSHEWFAYGGDARLKIEGTINADGTASGIAEGSYLDSDGETFCVGSAYEWTAALAGDDPDPVYDPSVLASPDSVTVTELAESGVQFTGTGFPAGEPVSLTLAGSEVGTERADQTGSVVFTLTSTSLAAGAHTATLASGEWSAEVTFVVIEDPEPQPDPEPEPQPDPEPEPQPDPEPEPRPELTIPENVPAESDLDPAAEGAIGVPASAAPGDDIAVKVETVDAGTPLGMWLFSDPVSLGTHTVSDAGVLTVSIPGDTSAGTHRIAAWSEAGLVGWAQIEITAEGQSGDPEDGEGSDDGRTATGEDEQADAGENLPATGATPSTVAVLLSLLLAGLGAILLSVRRAMARAL